MFIDRIKVSVVIPFYNNVSWLHDALTSVVQQSHSNLEIIIVNDGSKEDIDLEQFSDDNRIILFEQENKGPGPARNLGISQSTGEYIAFLDSDDLWKRDKIKRQLAAMVAHEAVWSCTSYEEFGINKSFVDSSAMSNHIYGKVLTSTRIATPTVMVKSEVFQQKEMRFSEDVRYGEDTYLWLQLSRKYQILYVPGYLTKVRNRGGNAKSQVQAHLAARAYIYQVLISNPDYYLWSDFPWLLKHAYKIAHKNFEKHRNKPSTNFNDLRYYLVPWLIFKVYSKFLYLGYIEQ